MHRFRQHIIQVSADFFTAGIRHNTKAAIFTAAFHDRQIGLAGTGIWLWQVVKFFDLGKTDIHQWLSRDCASEHLWQSVKRLWSEDHIHIRCALTDSSTFLACHTAADGDFQIRIAQL